ncbi:MAG: phytanoyl-CoA dioxygenase [Sphingobacteriales bacterium]|nr:MAG: phytanoyl-CoA dioxygenase [Sphingobacteriales bacterium]
MPIHKQISERGFAIVNNIFADDEINALVHLISKTDTSNSTFRKTSDLFAIRQFFKEVPAAVNIVFNERLVALIKDLFGKDLFVVKSIYFDKPEVSNWFVAYHQDLTISVDKKIDLPGFGPWTIKHNQFAVQPPLSILQDNITIRIHLDDTTEENGALKVLPGSHLKGICRPETIDWANETEEFCCVERGGIMFMKPLLLHASNRTTNNSARKVLHIEFSKTLLPEGLSWSEFLELFPQ